MSTIYENAVIIGITFCLHFISIQCGQGQLITGFSGGDDLSVGPGTAGYSFTVGGQDLTIQGLGIWDSSGTGLTASHQIGVWDTSSNHNLLASANVPASGATDLNGFWYVPITPLTLQSGTTYLLAAQYADVDFDMARGNAISVTLNGATFGDACLSSGIGFQFPDLNVSTANAGFFGPNAAFQAVPEPAATALVMAVMLAGLAAIRHRQCNKGS